MRLKLKDLKTKKVQYFAGYDSTSPLLVRWTPFLRDAINIKESSFAGIFNYLYLHIDFTKFKLEIEN